MIERQATQPALQCIPRTPQPEVTQTPALQCIPRTPQAPALQCIPRTPQAPALQRILTRQPSEAA
jgi:hypothetical protein